MYVVFALPIVGVADFCRKHISLFTCIEYVAPPLVMHQKIRCLPRHSQCNHFFKSPPPGPPPPPPPPPPHSIPNKRTVFSLLSGILSGLQKKLKWERSRGDGEHLLRSSPIHPVFISSENNSIFLDPTHPFQYSFNPHTSVICISSQALFSVLFQSTHFYINFSFPHIVYSIPNSSHPL